MRDLPKGTRIIECESIEFDHKDIVILKNIDDFLFVLGAYPIIYKLKDTYYNIGNGVAFVFTYNRREGQNEKTEKVN